MKTTRIRSARKLPVRQLTILAICRFAEPIASTSLLPYLPSMVRSFNVAEEDVGKWAGICSAIFSICQAIMGVPWGRFSDIYGRKVSILMGLVSTMITTTAWGLSRSLPFAITVRAIAGAGSGNVGIIRTTVAEMVPYKELQPLAFSIMPLVWNIGSVVGPALGGSLANPLNVEPGQTFKNPTFLQKFPYALPNLLSASIFAIGIIVGILFLEETLETLQDRRDLGLRTGDKLLSMFNKLKQRLRGFRTTRLHTTPEETQPLIKSIKGQQDNQAAISFVPRLPAPSFREVLNRQAVLNLVVYTLLAMHSMAFDQLLPVYLQYPRIFSGDGAVTKPSLSGNPFKFAGGVGLDHFTIGLISTSYGVFGMLVQFLVYPLVARRYGVLKCLRACACIFPAAFLLMPFTAVISSHRLQIAAVLALALIKCSCGIFAFPCSTILLTNAASSSRTLGTLNGFATSTSAIGRALGPALGGVIFSSGVKRGFVIPSWWTLMLVSIIAAVPVFWLIESDGFGGDEGENDDLDVINDDNHTQSARLTPGAVESSSTSQQDNLAMNLSASQSHPKNSAPADVFFDDDEDSGEDNILPLNRPVEDNTKRRGSPGVIRPLTIPAGSVQGISRRYSSNIGQSLGSSGGFIE